MADAQDDAPKAPRTITLSHRQLGSGAAIIATLAALAPIKEWFYTRAEGVAQEQRIVRMETAIEGLKNELTSRIDNSTDKIVDRIREAEERVAKNSDRLETRVNNIEAALRQKANKTN